MYEVSGRVYENKNEVRFRTTKFAAITYSALQPNERIPSADECNITKLVEVCNEIEETW